MVSYTITLGDRAAEPLILKPEEAYDMLTSGVRFAEYEPDYDRFRVSLPYRTLHNLERNTLTIEQK